MENYDRYAIYYAPEPGPLADFGAQWLGWDAQMGEWREPPALPGLPLPATDITATPRKYGFHGTIKPPFRLASGMNAVGLHRAMAALARRLPPVTLPRMVLSWIGSFVAIIPDGRATELANMASQVVMELDRFRAPLTATETARRRPEGLSETQRALLNRWGYPYVMEEFRFHLTLSGSLDPDDAAATLAALAPVVGPLIPQPFAITSLCLFGQAKDGQFHNLHRYTLSG